MVILLLFQITIMKSQYINFKLNIVVFAMIFLFYFNSLELVYSNL